MEEKSDGRVGRARFRRGIGRNRGRKLRRRVKIAELEVKQVAKKRAVVEEEADEEMVE